MNMHNLFQMILKVYIYMENDYIKTNNHIETVNINAINIE